MSQEVEKTENQELRLYRFYEEGIPEFYAHVLDYSEEEARERLAKKVRPKAKLVCAGSAGLKELKASILQNDILPF